MIRSWRAFLTLLRESFRLGYQARRRTPDEMRAVRVVCDALVAERKADPPPLGIMNWQPSDTVRAEAFIAARRQAEVVALQQDGPSRLVH